MDQDVKQKIEEQLSTLPRIMQEAIRTSGWERKVFDICKHYNMHVDEIGRVADELGMVLVGFSSPDDFKTKLKSYLGNASRVEELIEDINKRIVSHIHDFIKNYDVSKLDEEQEEKDEEPVVSSEETEDEKEEETKKEPSENVSKSEKIDLSKRENKYENFDPYREPIE